MEPDLDKILSNKIRQTEQQPVSWNKQGVWQNVQSQTSATRHPYFFYSTAAAIILLLIYFAVELTPGEINPLANDTVITPGQETTKSAEPFVPEKNPDPVPDPKTNDRKSTPSSPVAEGTATTMKSTQSVQRETRDIDAVIEPVLADIEIDADLEIKEEGQLSLREEIRVPEKKIRPIVGVITESYPENVANAKRKKPLRKLKSSDPMPWEDPANALVFVVKK